MQRKGLTLRAASQPRWRGGVLAVGVEGWLGYHTRATRLPSPPRGCCCCSRPCDLRITVLMVGTACMWKGTARPATPRYTWKPNRVSKRSWHCKHIGVIKAQGSAVKYMRSRALLVQVPRGRVKTPSRACSLLSSLLGWGE